MKKQNGSAVIGWFVGGGGVAVLALILFSSYISAFNYGNQMENQLKAEWSNNQNILAQYQQKILEAAQVPEMYKNDFKEVTTAAIQGRYGENGSKAVFQWLQEQNPNLDARIYIKLQQLIEAGRDDFKIAQTKLIDVKRQYETALGYFWQGMWLKIAGYPKTDLSIYKPITTDRVEQTFQKGKEDGPLKLR
jgi:hypothetical protein